MNEEEVNDPGVLGNLSQKRWNLIRILHLIPPGFLILSGLSLAVGSYGSEGFTLLLFLSAPVTGVLVAILTGGLCAEKSEHPIATFLGITLLSLIILASVMGLIFGACTAIYT